MKDNLENTFNDIFETIFETRIQDTYSIPEENSFGAAWDFSLRAAIALSPVFLLLTWMSISIDSISSIKFLWMGYLVICLYTLFIKREMFELVRFQLSNKHIFQFIDKDASNPIFDAAISHNQRRGKKSNIKIEIKEKSQIKITKSKIVIRSQNSFLFFGDTIIIPKQVENFENLKSEIIKTYSLN